MVCLLCPKCAFPFSLSVVQWCIREFVAEEERLNKLLLLTAVILKILVKIGKKNYNKKRSV